jgi:hypothetical protein
MNMMNLICLVTLTLAFVVASLGASKAEEIELEPVVVHNSAECLTVLAEFNWVCKEFDSKGWAKVFGRPFWERGDLEVFRGDLDDDGHEDIAMRINHVGECGSSGCTMSLLFGGEPPPKRLWSFALANTPQQVGITTRDGKNYIKFFDDWVVGPVSDLKAKTLTSTQTGLE